MGKTTDRPSYRPWYEANQARIAEAKRAKRAENGDEIREREAASRTKHREQRQVYGRAHYHANRDRAKERQRQFKRQMREQILDHYGRFCACCGEDAVEFLALDHTNGGGNTERKELGLTGGSEFYRYIVRQGFPEGYRILCHNCNFAIGAYGSCPHSRLKLMAS